MRKLYAVLLAVTAISTLLVASMVFIIPDHTGEMRTDLVIGDYYVVKSISMNEEVEYKILDIDETGLLKVGVITGGSLETISMTKERFLGQVYLDVNKVQKDRNMRAIIETNFGERMCSHYTSDLNGYWADSKNVIYKSFTGGTDFELIETSLFIQ